MLAFIVYENNVWKNQELPAANTYSVPLHYSPCLDIVSLG